MIDRSVLNLEALVRIYTVANTPAYLFKHFRQEESVRALAKQHTVSELIEEVKRISASERRTPFDIAIAYASLIALSFRSSDEAQAALPQLGSAKHITWLDAILSLVEATRTTAVANLNQAPSLDNREKRPIQASSSTVNLVAKTVIGTPK